MTQHYHHASGITKHGTHLAIVYAACLTAIAAKDVDALVV